MRSLCLALLLVATNAAFAQSTPLEAASSGNAMDAPELVESRRSSLVRLVPHLQYRRVPVNAQNCVEVAVDLQRSMPYQMFALRSPGQPALVPLEPAFSLREDVDVKRLSSLCLSTAEIAVVSFKPEFLQRVHSEPTLAKDYTIALYMSDWAQIKASGVASSGNAIPSLSLISLDPFSSLSAIAKLPKPDPVKAPEEAKVEDAKEPAEKK